MGKLYKDPLGENIFTQAPPSGNFSSTPAAMAHSVNADGPDDKVHFLERQVKDLKRQLYRARVSILNCCQSGHNM